jgi:hypothetical protein
MKGIITTGLLLAALPLAAQAGNCTGSPAATRVNGFTLTSAVSNKTVCASAPNGDTWQEWHQVGGTLTEYAKGPTDPVDPTHNVGTWARSGNTLVYTYPGNAPYSFELWSVGTAPAVYYFCDSANTNLVANVNSILAGQQACPAP